MKTPYAVLDVIEDADDEQIKKAYLAMVRRYPPERCPDEFQKVYAAYELIRTEENRIAYRLFHCELPTTQEIAALVLQAGPGGSQPAAKDFRTMFAGDLQRFCAGKRIV
ncbi:MAG: DnaJ domain-containing protein [Planctomycetes bacterium]|nr:DnaJ domain-containing protein [Planctomycetota bacterium]